MQPGAVVPGDVLHDRPPRAGPGGLGPQAGQFAFDRSGERFRESVIPALAFAPGRQGHLAVTGQDGELGGCVPAAPVGMEDHPRSGIADSDRVGQRPGD